MRPYLVILAFICAVLSSCKDELYQDKGGNPEDYPASSADPSLEALHSLQTDQQIMLSSMISNGKICGMRKLTAISLLHEDFSTLPSTILKKQ